MLAHPRQRSIRVCRPGGEVGPFVPPARIDLGDVLPGFELDLGEVFDRLRARPS